MLSSGLSRLLVMHSFNCLQKLNMNHKLTKIQFQDLTTLRDLFKIEWPKHIISYATIQTVIKKCEKNPKYFEDIKIWSLNNDWNSDGTFIIHVLVRSDV